MTTRHLLGVWNPSYEADAMDAHIEVLLRHARDLREGRTEEDEVYVWWGKLRSPYRQAPLPHLADILALDEHLAGEDEVHIYLTDYRSLYVAHLGGVTGDDVRANSHEATHIPAYYQSPSLVADCWFQLWDIRRLVLDDTPAVTAELRHLRNVHYHDQRVSLYGGMVDLPLIVTRPEPVRWFDDEVREQLTGGRHWVEFDAERAGAGAMMRELRDNRFGARLWSALDPSARAFIATAEQLFRDHRRDAAFDLATVIVDFAKAVELQVNALVRQGLAKASPAVRWVNLDGRSVDVGQGGPWGLSDLQVILGGDRERGDWFRTKLEHGTWFVTSLPPVLEELREVRNPAAHGGTVSRERVEQLRARLVGVGCAGTLVELAQVRVK